MIKKVLTVLLAACLLFGAIGVSPIAVYAEETDAEVADTVEEMEMGNRVTFNNTLDAPNADVKLRIAGLKSDGNLEHIKDHKNREDGWNQAMDLADNKKEMSKKDYLYIVVDLYDDWVAKDGEFTGDFINGAGFNWDAIYIPDNARVILNMNGHTIDRGLTEYQYNGEVIYVDQDATLIINGGKDSNDTTTGTIKGGFSCNGAGGIHINDDAYVTLNNVNIRDNTVEDDNGAGIAIYDGAKLVMNGGEFAGNRADFCSFNANLNIASECGGCLYADDDCEVYLNNVTMRDTEKVPNSTRVFVDGLCIAAVRGAKVTLSGCKVYDNTLKERDTLFFAAIGGTIKIKNNTEIYNNDICDSIIFYSFDEGGYTVEDSKIYENYGNGRVFSLSEGKLEAKNMTVIDNTLRVISYLTGSKGRLENCKFNNNFDKNPDGTKSGVYTFISVTHDVVFVDCDFGDSTFGKTPNIVTSSAVGSMIGDGNISIIISMGALCCGIVAVVIVLIDRKKRKAATLEKEEK